MVSWLSLRFGLMGGRAKREQSIRSPVTWTVLGLVIERPSYGWELWTRFERLYGDVLPVGGESNIYRALDALRSKRLIEELEEPRAVAGTLRQPKKHYRATAEGLEQYAEWVMAGEREHRRRSLLFARQLGALAGALAQEPETALAILGRYEQAWLDDKGARIPTASGFPSRPVPGLADRLASAYGRDVKAATLGWIEYARREFAALASRDPRRL
jgi:DNA-binding PadR family transcriptional regulator